MLRRRPSPRRALGISLLFALALLLKAAVPMLAASAAAAQGKLLAEICTVYGVVTAPVAGGGTSSTDAPDHPAAAHGGEHCVLAGLLLLPAPEPASALRVPSPASIATASPPAAPPAPPRDAVAHWAALLKHGPPVLS